MLAVDQVRVFSQRPDAFLLRHRRGDDGGGVGKLRCDILIDIFKLGLDIRVIISPRKAGG